MTVPEGMTPYRYKTLKRIADRNALGRHGQFASNRIESDVFDWLERNHLVICAEHIPGVGMMRSDYKPTDSGREVLAEIAFEGRMDRTLRQQKSIRMFVTGMRAYSVGFRQGAEPSIEISNRTQRGYSGSYWPMGPKALVQYDGDAFADVERTMGSNNIRPRHDDPLLVLHDRPRILSGGEVLHHVTAIQLLKGIPGLFERFLIRSVVDDVWIAAPTERAAKLRFRKHVPVLPEPELPAPRSAADDLEDAAIADAFF